MSFAAIAQSAPVLPPTRVAYPIQCLHDIPTGEFVQGERGNYIMMGGFADVNSTIGPGNSFKTDDEIYPGLTILGRFISSAMGIYDTENSLHYNRFYDRAGMFEGLEDFDFAAEQYKESPRFLIWRRDGIIGDEWFEVIKFLAKERIKSKAKNMLTLPVIEPNGKNAKVLPPMVIPIDSLSAFTVSSVKEKIVDQNAVGESGANTVFMKEGSAKTQLIMQLPYITVPAGIHICMTAHLGNFIQIDPYAPKPMSLSFSKNGTKQKGVPEKFMYINVHLKEVYNTSPLTHDQTKGPLFPLTDADKEKGNDLFLVTSVSTRNKNGPSGVTYPIVISQKEGIQPTLTEFLYCKRVVKNFGFQGNDQNYQSELFPEMTISRTTVRKKIKESHQLRTALRLQAEILQMMLLWKNIEGYWCTPKELYDDIKAMGYDWNILLNTRYWWTFKEEEHLTKRNELTIMDLFMMRKGLYHPYWLEDDKVTVKKEWMRDCYVK